MSFGAKSLLDAEAARTILEHWLEKDPHTGVLNKERSERVPPSKEACLELLKWKKRKLLRPRRPKEPAGPGKEGWEWADMHPDEELVDPDEYMRRQEDFSRVMEGMDKFGDRETELRKRRQQTREERDRTARSADGRRAPEREAFRAATADSSGKYDGLSSQSAKKRSFTERK